MHAGMKYSNGKACFVLSVSEKKRGGHCVAIAITDSADASLEACNAMVEANNAMKALNINALNRFANLIGIAKDAGYYCVESW